MGATQGLTAICQPCDAGRCFGFELAWGFGGLEGSRALGFRVEGFKVWGLRFMGCRVLSLGSESKGLGSG